MKKNLIFLFITTILLTGCTSEVLDLRPQTQLVYDVVFETPERIELCVIGCYDAAQSGYYPSNNQRRGYPFGAASIEQGDMRGEDMVNVQSFFLVTYNATYDVTSPNGRAMWEGVYQMNNKINITIEGILGAVENGIITDAKAKEYEAELRFLRALGMHELMIHFAFPYKKTADASHHGVPVSTVAINTQEKVEEAKNAGRATAAATYAQILEDLNFAESYLPETRGSGLHISRATKGAAIAAKTRIYQHMYDWSSVIAEATKIVNSSFTSPIGGYAIAPDPNTPWSSNSANTESIWSIENSDTDNCTNNGSLSQFYSTVRSLVCVSPIIINADWWLPEDTRREAYVKFENKIWWSHKYRARNVMDDWTPIIRYAEVILNYAEAEARSNGLTQKAVDLLNVIRNRGVTDPTKQFTLASFANVDEYMDALFKERRIEFLGEGRRWADIHRLSTDPKYAVEFSAGVPGVPNKVQYANIVQKESPDDAAGSYRPGMGILDVNLLRIAGFPATDTKFLWPIPLSETSTNEVVKGQQNPGWE